MATTNEFDKELEQLKTDVATLREDMATLIDTIKQAGLKEGSEAYEGMQTRARQAGADVRRRATEAYGAVGREVEERPLTSILVAFGTGFVVGMLLDRRGH
ncbi:MAG: DUF883 domain-containing protein [Gammaproteobacteria bacterium]|nr:DUF883 domain-containing protein [Gammaproteobacteria bacterium]